MYMCYILFYIFYIIYLLFFFASVNVHVDTWVVFIFNSNFFTSITKRKVKWLSRVRLFATPWTVAYQAPPSMGFSRQECWSGWPLPSPGDLPDPRIEP